MDGEKAWRQLHKNAGSNIELVLEATPRSSCMATYHPSWKLSKLDEPDTWDTAGEVGGWAHEWCTLVDPFTWPSKGRVTSSNIHTAALSRYGMQLWGPVGSDGWQGRVAREGQGDPCWWCDMMMMMMMMILKCFIGVENSYAMLNTILHGLY